MTTGEDDAKGASTAPGATDPAELPPGATRVQVRRAPKFAAFTVSGAVIGLVIGLLVIALAPQPATPTGFQPRSIALYLGMVGLLLGGVLGAGLAVLIDRRR